MTIAPERKGTRRPRGARHHPSGDVLRNPTTADPLRACRPPRRGADRPSRPVRRRHRPLHGPLAEGQVRRRRAGIARTASGGARSTATLSEQHFEGLRAKVADHLYEQEPLYVVDAFAGADPKHRISLRVITGDAVPRALLADDVHHAVRGRAAALRAARRSSCTRPASRRIPRRTARAPARSVFHPTRREILIGGTFYAGEIKKAIFTLMNDSLPLEGVLPMHCSANVGDDGRRRDLLRPLRHRQDDALGRPGAEADRRRRARLGRRGSSTSRAAATRRRSTSRARRSRRSGRRRTSSAPCSRTSRSTSAARSTSTTPRRPRTRAPPTSSSGCRTSCRRRAPAIRRTSSSSTADAFGILPPIARLTYDQARFYFLSGFTSKLAGTEIGVTEPEPTFSTCFGAPFLPQPPAVYSRMLGEKLEAHRRPSGS